MNRHQYMNNDKGDGLKPGDVFTVNSNGLKVRKSANLPSKIIIHYSHFIGTRKRWTTQWGMGIYEDQLIKLYDKTGFEPVVEAIMEIHAEGVRALRPVGVPRLFPPYDEDNE